jgi:GNAT superfamily N-acetyltransferase
MMAIERRYAEFADYSRISRFLDRFWAKDYIYVRKPELFDWTFSRADLWDHEGYSFALMEDKGELVGVLGAIPFVFNRLGQTSRAVWFANYMLCPEYRRGPLAMRLLSSFHRPPYDVNIAFGINTRVVPIYQRMGWKLLKPIPRYLAVLPDAVRRTSRLIRMAHPNCEADRAENVARFFALKRLPRASASFSVELPCTWDSNNWRILASATIGAARDLNYLRWRYLNHPCFKYRILAVPEGQRTGIAVWRLETIRRITAEAQEDVDRIGRLVEFLPASRENAGDLLSVFWNELLEADALGADFYGYHSEIATWIVDPGFRCVDSHSDGQMIPSRFQPLESKIGTILGAVFAEDSLLNSSTASHLMYCTKSDADQDRPN